MTPPYNLTGKDFISIHAPAKGATAYLEQYTDFAVDFNPRSREGSDRVKLLWLALTTHFNPRSREGSDEVETHLSGFRGNFNQRSREASDRRMVPGF